MSSSAERRRGVLLRRLLNNPALCVVKQSTPSDAPWLGADFYCWSDNKTLAIYLDSSHTRLLFLYLAHMAGNDCLRNELTRTLKSSATADYDSQASRVDQPQLRMAVIPDPPLPADESEPLVLFPPCSPCTEPHDRAVNVFFVAFNLVTRGYLPVALVQKIAVRALELLRRHFPHSEALLFPTDVTDLDEEDTCFAYLTEDPAGLANNPLQCLLCGKDFHQESNHGSGTSEETYDMLEGEIHDGPTLRGLVESAEGDGQGEVRDTPIMLRFPRVFVTHEELVALGQELARVCEEDANLRRETGNFFEMLDLKAYHVETLTRLGAGPGPSDKKLLGVIDPTDGKFVPWNEYVRQQYKASVLQGVHLVVNHFSKLDPPPREPPGIVDTDTALVTLHQQLQNCNLDWMEHEERFSAPGSPSSRSFADSRSCASTASSSAGTLARCALQQARMDTQQMICELDDSLFRSFMHDLFLYGLNPWTFNGRSIVLENCTVARITDEMHRRLYTYWVNRQHSRAPSLLHPPAHPPMSLFTEKLQKDFSSDLLDPITNEFLGKEERKAFERSVRATSKKEIYLDLFTEKTFPYVVRMEKLIAESGLFPHVRVAQALAVFAPEEILNERGDTPPWVGRLKPGDTGLTLDQLFYAKDLSAATPKRFLLRLCGPSSGKCVGHMLPSTPRVPSRKQQGPLLQDHLSSTVYHPEHHVILIFKPREKARPTAEANQRVLRETARFSGAGASSSRSLSEERNRFVRSVVMSVLCPVTRKERRLHLFGESAFMGLFGQRWSELTALQNSFETLEKKRREEYLVWLRDRFGPNIQATGLATGSLQGILTRMNSVSTASTSREEVGEVDEDELLGTDLGDMAHVKSRLQRQQEEQRRREELDGRRSRVVQISIEDIMRGPAPEQMEILEKSAPSIAKLPENWAPPDIAYLKKLFTRTLHSFEKPGQEASPDAPWTLPLLKMVIQNGLTLPAANVRNSRPAARPQFQEEETGAASSSSAPSKPRKPSQRPAPLPSSSHVGMVLGEFIHTIQSISRHSETSGQ